jgi:hypothetical protein
VGLLLGIPSLLLCVLADWVTDLLDVVAFALTLAGTCLFCTGHGLVLHATWARVLAGLGATGSLVVSFLVMTALQGGAA